MAVNKHSMQSLLVIRSLKLRLRRVVVVLAALTMGAAIVTAMAGVYFDINQKMSHELRNYGANFYVGPAAESATLSTQDYRTMLDLAPKAHLVASSPYLYGVVQSDLEKVVAMGVDFSQLKKLVPYWQVQGEWIGVSFDQRNAMIGTNLAKKLEVKVGSQLSIIQGDTRHTFTIKGIIDAGADEDNYLIVNISMLQKWLNQPEQANYAMFSIDNAQGQVSQYAERLKARYPNLTIRPILKVSASEGQVLNKIKLLMGVVAVVILILSTLCVNTTLTAMIGERRHEFALQKALGASHQAITRQILSETLLMTFAAIVIGLGVGYILAQILGQTVFSASIDLRLPVFIITTILSVCAALVAAIIPTLRAMKVDPAKVLKGE
ncbi:FtsX-like permease family protein [Vibrio ruber]|uniref:ABC transporter permease n=1 Tax=Vibrio ruber TaxID=184755 RepID=UPI002892DC32|nr:FtsX-like permease family protein [Vibrio ruber]WNJ94621.1 FtsX-like permease family protein [Vibrio ruber]